MAKKRFISKVIVVLLSIAIILPNLFTLAYASSAEVLNTTTNVRKGIVTAGGLNFREDSSLSSKIIRVLPRGTIVTIIEEADEWLCGEPHGTRRSRQGGAFRCGGLYLEHRPL